MAGSEDFIHAETPEAPYFNANLNNNNGAFVPVIADCMAKGDDKVEGNAMGFHSSHGEFVLNIEACPLQNPFDLGVDKTLKSDRDTHWDLKPEGPKEDSNAPFDPKTRDLFRRGDLGLDLETGREISGNGGSFWFSTRSLLGNAWNRFIRGDFVQSFNGSIPATRTEESFNPKMVLVKPAVEPFKCANPDSKIGENPRNIGQLGLEKLGNEKVRTHMKPSGKKPPKPPRPPRPLKAAATDPSKEKLMKGISDIALLRKAKLERIRSLKKKKTAKAKASNTNVWALVFTLCFCLIMIMQGMFSQGNGGSQISPVAAVQTRKFSLQINNNHPPNPPDREPWQVIGTNEPSAYKSHSGPGIDEVMPVRPDPNS